MRSVLNYRLSFCRPLRRAFTMIELLIVIGVMGLLIQMLLPAVEMAREAARRANCANNLRQLGLGVTMHETTHRHYPSGGWGFNWVGDPDRGSGKEQPGSWAYNVLSFVEQEAVRQRGAGLTGPARIAAIEEVCTTPLALFHCPSRRLPRAYTNGVELITVDGDARLEAEKVARSDYAINTGDDERAQPSGIAGLEFPRSYARTEEEGFKWYDTSKYTGISFGRSEIGPQRITDGLSHTYAVGEKYLPNTMYANGQHAGDNECLYSGFDDDNGRAARDVPWNDAAEVQGKKTNGAFANSFGGPHPAGWQIVMCDGSVHTLSFDIDLAVHKRLANRADGEPVSLSE